MSRGGLERIVVIVNKDRTFDVIKERPGEKYITLYSSQRKDGTENPLPYKNMKKMITSITKELKSRGEDLSNPKILETILRSVFQLYRIGNVSHPMLDDIQKQIPTPGMFDRTWEAWDTLTSIEKQNILIQLGSYFYDIDKYFGEIRKPFVERSFSKTQPITQSTEATQETGPSKITSEMYDNKLLLKAAKLASAGIISIALLKKLLDVYQSKTPTKKKTSKRRIIKMKPSEKKRSDKSSKHVHKRK